MPQTTKKIMKYTQESLLTAIEEVNNGSSVKSAAKRHGIPRVTLLYKVQGKLPVGKRMGPKSIFTEEQEDLLVKWVFHLAKVGFPVTKDIFMGSVAKLARKLGINKPPGEKWYKLFRGRHKNISDRIYQNLTKSRASVTQENLNKWFSEVETYLKDENLFSVMEDPCKVFNADETACYLNPKGSKVLAERGSKNVYLAGANDEKENITTLLTANAAGQLAPPMVVFRYQRIPLYIAEAVPSHWAIGRSENGWMTQELFYEYMANFFIPWLKQKEIQPPVVFFLDGHASHISYHVSELCSKHQIVLVALYPNATHLLQPMDVAVFHSLKNDWKKQVTEWRMSHMGQELKKKDFPSLLEAVLKNLQPTIFQNGFRKCGLMPWNPNAIHLEKAQKAKKIENRMDIEIFLNFLEKEIGKYKLETFKNNTGTEWYGEKEDVSLYKMWKQNKMKLEENENKEELEREEGSNTEVVFGEDGRNEEEPSSSKSQKLDETNKDPGLSMTLINKTAVENSLEELSSSKSEKLEKPIEYSGTKKTLIDKTAVENNILDELSSSKSQKLDKTIEYSGSRVTLVDKTTAESNSLRSPLKELNITLDPSIPSPFKDSLYWPGEKNEKKGSKKLRKEKIPAVISSPATIRYFKKKEEEKEKKRIEKERKFAIREQKKREKEESKQAKKPRKKLFEEENNESDSSTGSFSLDDNTDVSDEDISNDENNYCYEEVNEQNLKEGDFVLCQFFGGKRQQTKYIYLCVIQSKNTEIEIMGLRSVDTQKKEFILKENDVSCIMMEQIIQKLPQPQVNCRGERISYCFDRRLPVKEM